LYNRNTIRSTVTPLSVLAVDELEQISPYLVDTPFDLILESKYERDPSQSLPFSAVSNQLLASLPARANVSLEKKFERVIDEGCMDLFGTPYKRIEAQEVSTSGA
jgi:hypothetical protein